MRSLLLFSGLLLLAGCADDRPASRSPFPGGIVGSANISHKNISDYPVTIGYDGGTFPNQESATPVAPLQVQPSHQASQIWSVIKNSIGAYPKTNRDSLDQRIVDCVDGLQTCPRLASPASLPWTAPTPTAADDQPGTDADNDGMLDAEEFNIGAVSGTTDHNADADGDGYTNLQEYLWWKGRRL